MKETNLQNNTKDKKEQKYNKEEKIIKYDAITGKTTEIDMKQLIEKNKFFDYKNSNYTKPYNPLNLPGKNSTKSNRIMMDNYFTKITDTIIFPYIATCRIAVTPNLDSTVEIGEGTGFLVGPNMMLTAAHVLYDKDNNNELRNFTVYPGYNHGILQLYDKQYYSGWQVIYRSSIWLETHNPEYDWALVELDEDLGNKLGWYGIIKYNSGTFLDALKVDMLGYPDRLDNAKAQYYTTGNIIEVYDRYFKASMGNSEGMSGGPITPSSGDYEFYAVGIIKGNINHLLIDQTYGARITEYLIDLVKDNINNNSFKR